MEAERFLELIDEGIKRVYSEDSQLLELGVSERAIAHRLAVYLEDSHDFADYHVDCEYNRYGPDGMVKALPGIKNCRDSKEPKDWITPDILIHKRKSGDKDNLAVFEIKSLKALDNCDKMKLGGMTAKDGDFKYDFGLGVEFHRDYCNRLLVMNGNLDVEPVRVEVRTSPANHEKGNKTEHGANGQPSSALDKLREALKSLAADYDSSLFNPFLEEEVRAYVYHKWLTRNPTDGLQLRLEVRIDANKTKEHLDLGFGKTGIVGIRLGIVGLELVAEIKSLGGFTPNQLNRRRMGLVEDIRWLNSQVFPPETFRAAVMFDPKNLLGPKALAACRSLLGGPSRVVLFHLVIIEGRLKVLEYQ